MIIRRRTKEVINDKGEKKRYTNFYIEFEIVINDVISKQLIPIQITNFGSKPNKEKFKQLYYLSIPFESEVN